MEDQFHPNISRDSTGQFSVQGWSFESGEPVFIFTDTETNDQKKPLKFAQSILKK